MPFGNTHNQLKMNFTAEQEYPDLSKHNNHMAKVLSLEMYANLRDKQTPSGFTVDDVIQTGVDNPGKRPVFKLLQPALGCRQGGQTSKNLTCKFEFSGFLVCVLKWGGGMSQNVMTHPALLFLTNHITLLMNETAPPPNTTCSQLTLASFIL